MCMHAGDGGMVCRACEKNLILTALCLSLWSWMKVTFEQHQSWNFFLRKIKQRIKSVWYISRVNTCYVVLNKFLHLVTEALLHHLPMMFSVCSGR